VLRHLESCFPSWLHYSVRVAMCAGCHLVLGHGVRHQCVVVHVHLLDHKGPVGPVPAASVHRRNRGVYVRIVQGNTGGLVLGRALARFVILSLCWPLLGGRTAVPASRRMQVRCGQLCGRIMGRSRAVPVIAAAASAAAVARNCSAQRQ